MEAEGFFKMFVPGAACDSDRNSAFLGLHLLASLDLLMVEGTGEPSGIQSLTRHALSYKEKGYYGS
jgi:hypothetical protein